MANKYIKDLVGQGPVMDAEGSPITGLTGPVSISQKGLMEFTNAGDVEDSFKHECFFEGAVACKRPGSSVIHLWDEADALDGTPPLGFVVATKGDPYSPGGTATIKVQTEGVVDLSRFRGWEATNVADNEAFPYMGDDAQAYLSKFAGSVVYYRHQGSTSTASQPGTAGAGSLNTPIGPVVNATEAAAGNHAQEVRIGIAFSEDHAQNNGATRNITTGGQLIAVSGLVPKPVFPAGFLIDGRYLSLLPLGFTHAISNPHRPTHLTSGGFEGYQDVIDGNATPANLRSGVTAIDVGTIEGLKGGDLNIGYSQSVLRLAAESTITFGRAFTGASAGSYSGSQVYITTEDLDASQNPTDVHAKYLRSAGSLWAVGSVYAQRGFQVGKGSSAGNLNIDGSAVDYYNSIIRAGGDFLNITLGERDRNAQLPSSFSVEIPNKGKALTAGWLNPDKQATLLPGGVGAAHQRYGVDVRGDLFVHGLDSSPAELVLAGTDADASQGNAPSGKIRALDANGVVFDAITIKVADSNLIAENDPNNQGVIINRSLRVTGDLSVDGSQLQMQPVAEALAIQTHRVGAGGAGEWNQEYPIFLSTSIGDDDGVQFSPNARVAYGQGDNPNGVVTRRDLSYAASSGMLRVPKLQVGNAQYLAIGSFPWADPIISAKDQDALEWPIMHLRYEDFGEHRPHPVFEYRLEVCAPGAASDVDDATGGEYISARVYHDELQFRHRHPTKDEVQYRLRPGDYYLEAGANDFHSAHLLVEAPQGLITFGSSANLTGADRPNNISDHGEPIFAVVDGAFSDAQTSFLRFAVGSTDNSIQLGSNADPGSDDTKVYFAKELEFWTNGSVGSNATHYLSSGLTTNSGNYSFKVIPGHGAIVSDGSAVLSDDDAILNTTYLSHTKNSFAIAGMNWPAENTANIWLMPDGGDSTPVNISTALHSDLYVKGSHHYGDPQSQGQTDHLRQQLVGPNIIGAGLADANHSVASSGTVHAAQLVSYQLDSRHPGQSFIDNVKAGGAADAAVKWRASRSAGTLEVPATLAENSAILRIEAQNWRGNEAGEFGTAAAIDLCMHDPNNGGRIKLNINVADTLTKLYEFNETGFITKRPIYDADSNLRIEFSTFTDIEDSDRDAKTKVHSGLWTSGDLLSSNNLAVGLADTDATSNALSSSHYSSIMDSHGHPRVRFYRGSAATGSGPICFTGSHDDALNLPTDFGSSGNGSVWITGGRMTFGAEKGLKEYEDSPLATNSGYDFTLYSDQDDPNFTVDASIRPVNEIEICWTSQPTTTTGQNETPAAHSAAVNNWEGIGHQKGIRIGGDLPWHFPTLQGVANSFNETNISRQEQNQRIKDYWPRGPMCPLEVIQRGNYPSWKVPLYGHGILLRRDIRLGPGTNRSIDGAGWTFRAGWQEYPHLFFSVLGPRDYDDQYHTSANGAAEKRPQIRA